MLFTAAPIITCEQVVRHFILVLFEPVMELGAAKIKMVTDRVLLQGSAGYFKLGG
ncbi:hypothetical protein imdm_1229 [gamma proteobacterium IMCC2047]|nr:hypothetical protein imdm_1229 [gamma proteobacterium IMCC2047]